ncbi:MAG: HAMP domain-containing sensor histidine kinase, partial [Chitinophagaceae bacterium]|nr:HAMP domain-containing sensor histidine kinase [Chitinophagaceae bacterium]
MSPRRTRSLRMALQSSTLIAVLAGYGLLLAVGGTLAALERRQAHAQLVSALAGGLENGTERTGELVRYRLFGLSAWLEPAAAPLRRQGPLLQASGDQHWLESRTPVQPAGAPRQMLVVRQNVTDLVARQRTLLLLLLAAAGLASLFTAALLRPVLRRDLVRPIEALCQRLQTISAPQWGGAPLLPQAEQPQELQPIAAAFAALQQRLAAAWGRERSFTDGAAHELRTPITLISGQAQSLLRYPLLPQQRTAVQAIAREAEHMGSLMRHLLDLSRQDAGRLQLLPAPLDPEALVLEAFDRLRPLAPARLQLAAAADAAAPPPLPADRERLLQCLSALVDNALVYAPAGPVELAVSWDRGTVTWHVRDRGPGVAAEERERIFERFVRGHAATAADTRGSGLGLALVRLLMEAMGGSAAVADHAGGGADFQLQLPLSPSP